MTQNSWTEAEAGEGASHDATNANGGEGARPAEGLLRDAGDAVSDVGERAKQIGAEKADDVQSATADHLSKFADAVRTAGDELAAKDPGEISDLVQKAAEGLERFSDVLGRKSSAEMLEGVREFGRKNPMGFLAGSLLVGFSLSRLASASPDRNGSSDRRADRGDEKPVGSEPMAARGEPASRAPAYDAAENGSGFVGLNDATSERQSGSFFENTRRTEV